MTATVDVGSSNKINTRLSEEDGHEHTSGGRTKISNESKKKETSDKKSKYGETIGTVSELGWRTAAITSDERVKKNVVDRDKGTKCSEKCPKI